MSYDAGWTIKINENFNAIEIMANPPVPQEPVVYTRAKLMSNREVARDIAKIYCEAREGRVDTKDASRPANMLAIISRIISGDDLEDRIEKLEKVNG